MRHRGKVLPIPDGLVGVGPLVSVIITPDPKLKNFLNLPSNQVPFTSVKLMVDTGAQRTCIEDNILRQLGLIPINYTYLIGVNQEPELHPVYRPGLCR